MAINNWEDYKTAETATDFQGSGKSKWRITMLNNEEGAIGWILLWVLGIPIPILVVLFLLRGCT
jgi:hypothetical protein